MRRRSRRDRSSTSAGAFLVEPFLFVGLIAVVRRVPVLMAEAEGGRRAENTGDPPPAGSGPDAVDDVGP